MTDPTFRPDATRADTREPLPPGTDRAPIAPTAADSATARPMTEDEKDTVKATGTAATAAAGAVAGATAGLATGVFGPIGAAVGAVVGAFGGAAAGAAGAQAATNDVYTAEHDAHYRALWESMPGRPADRTYESARVAYQFGHVAAQHPDFAGRYFASVEPELRREWSDEFRARAGEWDAVCRYVEDAYSHARAEGLGERRDRSVVGSAGSAVDPVELERARAGLPSRELPGTT